MAKRPLITLLIPAYNEQAVLPALFDRLIMLAGKTTDYEFEFLFIDDGSKDKTLAMIKKQALQTPQISYISLSRNFGKEVAVMPGIDHAKGDAVVIIDADLQDPPELIPEMIQYWQEGYDDVYAKRRSRDGESWLKKTTSMLYYRVLQKVTNIPIQKDTGDFRLLDRRVVDELKKYRESDRNMKALFSLVGFHKKEILYDRDKRFAGETKWNYPKLVNFAIDGITSFTTAPLRVASVLGFIIFIFSVCYIIYLLVRPLFGVPTGDGYSSLMVTVLFLGGVQLLSLGVIGEYIARIFNETKKRPLYLIDEHYEGKISKSRR